MIFVTIVNNDLNTLIPLLFEFKKTITKHILIYDEAQTEKNNAIKLKNGIEKINKKYNLKADIELIKVDEDSKTQLLELQSHFQKYSDKLYLNANESDLALSIVISGFILQQGGSVLAYDKFDNSYNEINQNGFTNHIIKHNLDLKSYFKYMGYKLISSKDPISTKNKSKRLNNIFKTPQKLFQIIHILKTKKIKYIDKSFKEALISLKVIDQSYKIKKDFRGFGVLFEEFIFLKLSDYDFDDILLGAEISFDDDLEVVNEFDILAIKNNHIIVVECKFGNPALANEIIYKLDSVMENFGEDAKGFIVNLQQNYDYFSNDHHFVKKIFSKKSHLRAKYNNLEIYNDYTFDEMVFHEIVSDFLNVTPKTNKNIKNKPVFLLGGYDLEMVEIKKILQENSIPFIDKKLSWGAKLSFYSDILNDKTTFYGIELIEDITPPKNYIAIDHHNDIQDKPSSIEQVAKILNIKLNRYQKLVALNDKGYIPAMKKFGATEVEIELIRQKDREAQGVTYEDELLAQMSIENAKKINDVFVVKAQTEHFSAIVDRLYEKEKNILIFSANKLVYYGNGVEQLVNYYKKEIEKNKAYYGGNFGFFGFAKGKYNKEGILKKKDEVLEFLQKKGAL